MKKVHRGTPSCDITWISLVRSHQLSVDVGGGLRRPRGKYSDLVAAHDVTVRDILHTGAAQDPDFHVDL